MMADNRVWLGKVSEYVGDKSKLETSQLIERIYSSICPVLSIILLHYPLTYFRSKVTFTVASFHAHALLVPNQVLRG